MVTTTTYVRHGMIHQVDSQEQSHPNLDIQDTFEAQRAHSQEGKSHHWRAASVKCCEAMVFGAMESSKNVAYRSAISLHIRPKGVFPEAHLRGNCVKPVSAI